MSNDDNDQNFDLEAMLEESMPEDEEDWQFELDEDGDLMDMATFSKKDVAKLIAVSVALRILEFLVVIGIGFLLVWGIVFLMGAAGVAIPVQ